MTVAPSYTTLAPEFHRFGKMSTVTRCGIDSATPCTQSVSGSGFGIYEISPGSVINGLNLADLRHLENVSVSEMDTYKSAKTLWHYIFARLAQSEKRLPQLLTDQELLAFYEAIR
jgi:hypothetical protein